MKFSIERKKDKTGAMVIKGVDQSLLKYLKGQIINNMIAGGNRIIAFEH